MDVSHACPSMTICVVNQLKNDSYCWGLYVHPGFGHVAPLVHSSSDELLLPHAFNRSGTSRRIAPNIRVFIFCSRLLSKQRKVKSVMKLYSENNFSYFHNKRYIFNVQKILEHILTPRVRFAQ